MLQAPCSALYIVPSMPEQWLAVEASLFPSWRRGGWTSPVTCTRSLSTWVMASGFEPGQSAARMNSPELIWGLAKYLGLWEGHQCRTQGIGVPAVNQWGWQHPKDKQKQILGFFLPHVSKIGDGEAGNVDQLPVGTVKNKLQQGPALSSQKTQKA